MSFPSSLRPKNKENLPSSLKKKNDRLPSSLKPKQNQKDENEVLRNILQIPQGLAEATAPAIAASLWQTLASGETELDLEEEQRLKQIGERVGKPFDEEKYNQAKQQALRSVPTVSNIASRIEEKTGIPLEPKSKMQKAVRLGSSTFGYQPGSISQKAVSGVTAPLVSHGLQEIGVPEPFADIAGTGIGITLGSKSPSISYDVSKKQSGLTERGFESLNKPREVSQNKFQSINESLEKDFRDISSKIIDESPIGETSFNLKNDPTFKQQSRELLNEAQKIADSIPDTVLSKTVKKEIADVSSKKSKGFADSEYDKSYNKFIKESIDDIKGDSITASQLVEQYRKNNVSLSEHFEPGSSKALNNAKRDALLDQNIAIANVLKKSYKRSDLSDVFTAGNERWTKIKRVEAVDEFINELFSDKVNYKKMHDFFDKKGYGQTFKKALGEKQFKNFENLMKDMISSESAYKMLKIAKDKGYTKLFQTGLSYILHPKLGILKAGYDAAKYAKKALLNSMLDKPKKALIWKNAIKELKQGNFKKAEFLFNELDEIEK